MQVIGGIEATRAALRAQPRPLGLVPTMGALHAGHLSLVQAARRDCASTAVSIFVNPAQFSPREDFASYPRDLDGDLDLLRAAGVDVVFTPDTATIYPPGFQTTVTVGPLADRLEGAARPGHFAGVATVVAKLFLIVQPDRAYFGQKDGQQALVVQRMVRDLDFPLEIVVMSTVRDADGLALSSRNVYLAPEQRQAALALSRGLFAAQRLCSAGERDAERLRATVRAELAREPLAEPEYVSLADRETLEELDRVDRPALLSLAVRVGATRLIDNVLLVP
jgi:pantoate--beta-alanine ligase